MRKIGCLVTLAVLPLAHPAAGQDPVTGKDPTEDLIALERIRSAVDSIFETYLQPAADGTDRVDMAIRAAQDLVAVGPEVVPYLENELEAERHETYDLCAYALGLLGTDQAEKVLREAVARANEDPSNAALSRKAWAVWALGLQGHADAVRLTTEGRGVANFGMHARMSLIESVAVQTAPQSLPLLFELLDTLIDDDERWPERSVTMRAVRWVGDLSAAPRFVEMAGHADLVMRREAINTLRRLPTREAVETVVKALEDEDHTVRRSAAVALEVMGGSVDPSTILARLRTETDALTRGALYRLMVDLGGGAAFDLLTEFRGRPDPRDRRYLIEALARTDDSRRVAVLRDALTESDLGVQLEAVRALGIIGDDDAVVALIGAIRESRLPVVRVAAEELARLRARAAGAAIHERLMTDIRTRDVDDPAVWDPLERMTLSLIELGYTDGLKEFREKADTQTDATTRKILSTAIEGLEWIRRNGRKASRWIEATKSEQPELRRLAWSQLGQIGSAEALRALVAGFTDADHDDRLGILNVLGEQSEKVARPVLERVLLDPEFDAPGHAPLRDMAAWSARRIGGERMRDLLEAAVRRRDGRDPRVFIYAVILGRDKALPLLKELRRNRLRYIGWTRAIEQERLDWLAARLVNGRSMDAMDVPPRRLSFR